MEKSERGCMEKSERGCMERSERGCMEKSGCGCMEKRGGGEVACVHVEGLGGVCVCVWGGGGGHGKGEWCKVACLCMGGARRPIAVMLGPYSGRWVAVT